MGGARFGTQSAFNSRNYNFGVSGTAVDTVQPLGNNPVSRGSSSLLAAMMPAARLPPGSHFHRISLLDGEVAYIYPRRDKIVLGGTYLPLPKDVSLDGPDAWRTAFDEDAKVRHRDASAKWDAAKGALTVTMPLDKSDALLP